MEQNHSPMNPQNETDILVLLEYFKNGIKSIFSGIGNSIKSFFKSLIWLILLIKKNIILVIAIMTIFIIFSFFKKDILGEKYSYSLTIKPNYGSTETVYKLVESIKGQANEEGEYCYIKDIEINPVKSINSEIDIYYSIIGDDFDINSNMKQINERDTIIFRQLPFKEYKAQADDKDFKVHEITIKSTKKFSKQDIYNLIIAPVENNKSLQRVKNTYLTSIDKNIKFQEKAIAKIDTLLAQVGKRQQESNTFSMKAEAKNNVEEDLLEQYSKYTNHVVNLLNKKALYHDILTIVSEGNRVSPKRISNVNSVGYALYGFIFSLLILLLIAFWKYLGKLERKENS